VTSSALIVKQVPVLVTLLISTVFSVISPHSDTSCAANVVQWLTLKMNKSLSKVCSVQTSAVQVSKFPSSSKSTKGSAAPNPSPERSKVIFALLFNPILLVLLTNIELLPILTSPLRLVPEPLIASKKFISPKLESSKITRPPAPVKL